MKIVQCEPAGLLIIEPKVFGDSRGFFMETWNRRRLQEQGLDLDFVQDNLSLSRRGVLRGLHFQNPAPQAKLVSVLQGEVLDVAVDIRRSSPTFGRWRSVVLTSDNKKQFLIPRGFAHGFMVLSETAMFYYKCTNYYSPKDELTVRWNDPDLGIEWPQGTPLLSEKDANAPCLREIPPERLFD